MLVIGLIFILLIGASSLIGINDREKVMNEFCKVECKQNIQKKYTF